MSPQLPRLRLLVAGDSVVTHWLPDAGSLTLGNGEDCDIQVGEPVTAVLRIGEEVTLEPAPDSAAIQLGDALILPGQRQVLRPGESLLLGDTLIVLQRRGQVEAPARRILSYGYFESRLEEECLRAARYHSTFGVIRLRTPEREHAAVEEVLASGLRAVDLVAAYGPGQYDILLPDTPLENVEVVVQRLKGALAARGIPESMGVARFPRDGHSPHELSAQAGAAVLGPETLSSSQLLPGGMEELEGWVARVAKGMISVLILGETGVGKERLAEQIHQRSQRAAGPFLRLNCAALSESLLESELFGHEKGAFTGAVQTKPGLLETAQGGTVFFDEVGELPLSMQVKLLRVIEERQATRVGGLKPYSIDVRFVSATNRDLEAEIDRSRFREDLYFRLNGISLVIPPLRERRKEIPEMVKLFIEEACRRSARSDIPRLSAAALGVLQQYRWPGNIRELRNVVERAVLLCTDDAIHPEHLPMDRLGASFAPRKSYRPPQPTEAPTPPPPAPASPEPPQVATVTELRLTDGARQQAEQYERRRIQEALTSCAGNQSEAAKLLGISRRTLLNRLDAYNLPRPRKGRARG